MKNNQQSESDDVHPVDIDSASSGIDIESIALIHDCEGNIWECPVETGNARGKCFTLFQANEYRDETTDAFACKCVDTLLEDAIDCGNICSHENAGKVNGPLPDWSWSGRAGR